MTEGFKEICAITHTAQPHRAAAGGRHSADPIAPFRKPHPAPTVGFLWPPGEAAPWQHPAPQPPFAPSLEVTNYGTVTNWGTAPSSRPQPPGRSRVRRQRWGRACCRAESMQAAVPVMHQPPAPWGSSARASQVIDYTIH